MMEGGREWGEAERQRERQRKETNSRVTPMMVQLGPILQPSPITISATGVSMIMQPRLMNVDPPTCRRTP